MGNLTVQAMALDLYVHQMAGLDPDAARAAYAIPDGFHAFTAFAVGYKADPDTLDETWMREAERAPRDRKPFDEFIFTGRFGKPSPLVG